MKQNTTFSLVQYKGSKWDFAKPARGEFNKINFTETCYDRV